ncbi:hypothetical protein ACOXXX_07740 [Thalassococcus sp. BH17M4-6]|uniref:hypothetical protein n=1 Tax=Thalassococcus sp. BH17M4-6 TaxID=3413148 RepID=UPI003BC1CCB1
MVQAPASSKLKRAALLAATAVVGPRIARRGEALVASERAALDLRAALPASRPRAETVTFLIPLVGPDDVGDWDVVTARLGQTLQSLLDQDDPRWRAVIACQHTPPLPDNPRITHLPFDDPTPGNDKWRKLAALCDHLPRLDLPPGYVMSFDADDLLRQGTVAEMLNRQAKGGYLVQAGFVMDHATGAVALADAPGLAAPLRKPFWKLCGSCAALFHDPALPESAAFLRAMTAHEHRMFPYLARLAGLRLSALHRPSVLYVLNHGENFGARRGRVGFKTRFVERFRISDPATLSAIAAEFPAP